MIYEDGNNMEYLRLFLYHIKIILLFVSMVTFIFIFIFISKYIVELVKRKI